jgi:hypothetical protein
VYLSSTNSSTLKSQLGLTYVPYPYPAGSWNDYFSYVQSSSYLYNAGYRQKYGMLTLVNYWLERYPAASQTPVLWQTSEQPVTAVKDALALFLAYIQEVYTEDQVGLVVYTYTDGMAIQETSLTKDFTQVQDLAKHRQAGHYTSMTNIGDGLKEARLDLQNHARAGAFKMIVLMTDGLANLPGSDPSGYLLQQAQLCADARYPVITISLGAGADTSIMQQVADITGGAHFNVPGGATVGAYDEQLRDTFRQIADSRPLKIVK